MEDKSKKGVIAVLICAVVVLVMLVTVLVVVLVMTYGFGVSENDSTTTTTRLPEPTDVTLPTRATTTVVISATTTAPLSPSSTATTTVTTTVPTTSNVSSDVSFDEKIQSIKDRWNAYWNSEKASCEEVIYTTHAVAYFDDNGLRELLEYPQLSPEGEPSTNEIYNCNNYWFYDPKRDELYFILMTNTFTQEEYRLYFCDGELLQWIDGNGVTHINDGYRWDEMQSIYTYALEKCQSVIEHR